MPLTKINRLPTYRTEAHHGCSRSLIVCEVWDVEMQEICERLNCDSLLVQQRMWQEVQWQEARNDFKRKYAQFEQSDDREEENVGQKCVWVLWYDESVIAGLDLSQSCCFKDTSHFCCGQSLRFEIKDDAEGRVRSSDLSESVMKWKLVACLLDASQRNNREGDWEGQRERERHRCQPLGFHRLSWSPLLSPSICPLALFHPLSLHPRD